jgi:hypothetical protein
MRLKTTIRGNKAKSIIKKAEKNLLRERKHQCEFTIKKIKIEKDKLETEFYDMLDDDNTASRTRLELAAMFKCENEKCKTKQVRKFEKLKNTRDREVQQRQDSEIKTRWVINKSSRALSDSEKSLLTRGLKFAITPKSPPVDEIIAATEEACAILKDPKTAQSLRSEVVKAVKSAKAPRSNISKAEQQALKVLKAEKDILILPADKGCATVILDKSEYVAKMDALVKDEKTYTQLSKDPTQKYRNKLIKELRSLKKDVPEYLYWQMYPSGVIPPRIYGLPKIHKPSVPLRPIVSSIGTVSYGVARYLAKVISPLVGKTDHFVKDSTDFVKKIQGLEVPPGHKLVSYDVTALFTSIPTADALKVIERYLRRDQTLSDRCPLTVEQLLMLLEFCLSTTYFLYNGDMYQQTHGAAMGSPVSPLVANVYMEDFEARALSSSPSPPSMWLRYVDDTFVQLKEDEFDSFTQHINGIDPNIKFTSEKEEEGKLAFLDVLIHVQDDGSIKTTVYRKATHTDQYLNGLSHHPLEHKRSVARSLLNRADNIISKEEDRVCEKEHVKNVLEVNDFDAWMMHIPRKTQEQRTPPNTGNVARNQLRPIAVPYYRGLSEKLQRVYKAHGVPVYHLPWNTLRQALVHPKDPIDSMQKCNVVYQITCGECNIQYVGETKRQLKVRFEEHVDDSTPITAVGEHQNLTLHQIKPENCKVLCSEPHWLRRRVREAIHIQRQKPQLNRDPGLELPVIYSHVVSRDALPSQSRGTTSLHLP